MTGPEEVLPSALAVTAFATASVGVATLAVAELSTHGSAALPPRVSVGSEEACAAFRSEQLFEPHGWERPPLWDAVAGDYRAQDRFIKLHTNYTPHRVAALAVLGTTADRALVQRAVARWNAADLERTIEGAGGCAAAMYTREEWARHAHGAATWDEPAVALADQGVLSEAQAHRGAAEGASLPLSGMRVLDLTRVIAGPVCTRFLAAYGADVLRLDPPGFVEVPALVPDVTVGKRCAALSLATDAGRRRFGDLVAAADVIVSGLRPHALERLGFSDRVLRARNPGLVIATLDAYGFRGPWRGRRGFDSLVQMSSGIAAVAGADKPRPLPAQALDHGAGYLLAAGVCRALTLRVRDGRVSTVRASLLGVANHLFALGASSGRDAATLPPWPDDVFETATTAWGPARRVRCPGAIQGWPRPSWRREAGPIGAITNPADIVW